MAIEDIEKKISEEASIESEKIKKEAEDKKATILKKADDRAKEDEKEIFKMAESSAEAQKRAVLTPLRLKAKREVLKAKQNIIDSAFNDALKALSKLSKTEYKKCMLDLISQVPYSRSVEIIPRKGDQKLIKSALDGIKRENKKKGREFKYKVLSARKGLSGGFIARSGRVEIDLTFDSLIGELKEKLQGQVAEILFK